MKIENNTPFPAIVWPSLDPKDNSYITILCRVKLLFDSRGDDGLWSLKFDQDQGELFESDVFYDKSTFSVKYESDYAPYKRQADLIVNIDHTKHDLIGSGIEVIRYDDGGIGHSMIRNMSPKNFGFIHRSDSSRLRWIGTTDQRWIETRAPKYPKDFDEKHYNAAHPNLQLLNRYFEPGDVLVLHKLLPGVHKQMIMLPGIYPYATVMESGKKRGVMLEADTVILDIEEMDMEKNSIYISYRKRVEFFKKVESVSIDVKLEPLFIEERSA